MAVPLTKLKIEMSPKEFNNYSNNLCGVLFQLRNIEELTIITTPYIPTPTSTLASIEKLSLNHPKSFATIQDVTGLDGSI